jgi:hypothetical protein
MTIRVTSTDTDPWEGTVSDFIDGQPEEIPELTRRRIETLPVGQHIEPEFAGTRFRIERIA